MSITGAEETRRDRVALARRAGVARISGVSVIAGVLVAYAAFALLVGIGTAVVGALGVDADLTDREWRRVGTGAGITGGVLLFASYFFGGYVAGRMARRAGPTNGLAVFFGGLLVAGTTVAVVEAAAASEAAITRLKEALESFGAPASGAQWGDIGSVAGIAALVGMLFGGLLGGAIGDRWHTKLTRSAMEVDIRERPVQRQPIEEGTPIGQDEAKAGEGSGEVIRSNEAPPTGDALESRTKQDLYHRAQDAEVQGRSQMTKDELIDALHEVEDK